MRVRTLSPELAASFGIPGARTSELEALCRHQVRLHRRAHACCVASRWAADELVADHGVPAQRVHVVGWARNVELSPPLDRDWSVPRFLFVGHDWARKNGDAVVRAFRAVRRRMPQAELHVVGLHPPLEVEGVTGHGRIPAHTPDGRARLAQLFAHATCFVMPSWVEPFGIVYLEAAGAGLPSIGTTRGGTATSIGDGGVCVDPDDDDAIAGAMQRLAEPEEAAALGRTAHRRLEDFSWAKTAQRILRASELPPPAGLALAEYL
jgi:glycosyltransferase involved in cell wall biosynthesis